MSQVETEAVLIKGNDDQNSDGLLQVIVYTPKERLKRAALVWGGLWLLAVLSVPIIIAHFVLVPGFLIAGPIVGMKRYRTERIPQHVSGQCPVCKEAVVIPFEPTDQLPVWKYCSANNDPIQLISANR